jgi:hypothetical protein
MRRVGNSQRNDGGYLKVSPAARYLGVCPNTLRRYTDLGWVKAKILPGGDRIYRRQWLDEFIQGLPDAVPKQESLEPPVAPTYNRDQSDLSSILTERRD